MGLYGGKITKDDLKNIEKGVRAVVWDLNKAGQRTLMSCQGHEGAGTSHCIRRGDRINDDVRVHEKGRGWISFNEKGFQKDLVLSILKKHGLKRIRVYPASRDNVISVSFSRAVSGDRGRL